MFVPQKLHFGPSGIPHGTPNRNTRPGIQYVREFGLDGMELAFVQTVYLKEEAALEVCALAKKLGVLLTVHAPYYVNFSSQDPAIVRASKERVLRAARIGALAGAWSVTFHAGYYQKNDGKTVYANVRNALVEISQRLADEGTEIWLRPETTGKPTQFGDLNELVALSKEIPNVQPCIDFSHLHARTNGLNNSRQEFTECLAFVEKELGKDALHTMHMHLSGIAYGVKGEKHHLILQESDMKYKELLQTLKEFGVKGSLVCESPNQEDDALLLKKLYEQPLA